MPDWFAHLMLATVASTCLRLDPWKRTLLFVGSVMPDLVRVLVLVDSVVHSGWFYTFVALPVNTGSHTLLGLLAYSLFLSLFFEPALPAAVTGKGLGAVIGRRSVPAARLARWWRDASRSPFFLLFVGGVLHLFLDTFMWPYGSGIMWLYPLSDAWFRWSFGAWWPGAVDGILWLSPFFAAAVAVEVAAWARRARGRRA
ncbi:MAG: metal-dependent hydrolase [Candidatus Lokiarchaeota archaeon]|nr:metal-dependent hydrolase [Candidatus Lokiarchaeota archaeon]